LIIGGRILIEIKNIDFSYYEREVFKNFSLKLEDGKFYTLLGKNGSGKSTLVKLLLGIVKVKSGEILVDGKNLTDNLYEVRKNIGMVFQNPDEQIVSERIDEELAFSMENYGYSSMEMRERIEEVLQEINLLEKRDLRISQLSGGEKQRLCIGSALMLKPKVLVLDEGTAMLDEKNRENIMELLKRLRDRGVTILLISHHLDELKYVDEVIYLKNGELWQGDRDKFLKEIITGSLGESLELPPNFYIAREIFRRKGLDISKNLFSSEEVAEHLWRLSLKK
jgi:energy-coupling factor transport system ATP-binding protein